jgi:hypothetical protein
LQHNTYVLVCKLVNIIFFNKMGFTSVYFIRSSVTPNNLYYTRFYLSSSFGSAKSHHQAANNITKWKALYIIGTYRVSIFIFFVNGLMMAVC